MLIELEKRRCQDAYAKMPSGREIDFVARDQNGITTYIQVCSDLSLQEVRDREFGPLLELLTVKPKAHCVLLSGTTTDAAIAQKYAPADVTVRPAWEWILAR